MLRAVIVVSGHAKLMISDKVPSGTDGIEVCAASRLTSEQHCSIAINPLSKRQIVLLNEIIIDLVSLIYHCMT